MTRPFDKHLDSDELDRLVSLQETSVSGSEQLLEPALREAQRHVESCQDCSRRLQRHQFVHSEILRMRAPNPSPPTPECMGDAEWLEVAAGLLPEAKTRELMKHAAQCGHCGPLLRVAAEALSDDATPEEETLVASLNSARSDWRGRMAEMLQTTAVPQQKMEYCASWSRGLFYWPRPAFAAAAIALLVLAGWLSVRTLYPPSAEQLLAQAYTERRTIEVRIPGARYAPLHVERSISHSNFDKPASLLKAEVIIAENLRKNPGDSGSLQAKARADVLDGNYDSAIKALQRALQEQPDSAALLTDLATGYYLRAESTNRPIDYGIAVDTLGKALARSPNDAVAIFNRAIVEEKLHLYQPSISDWQQYLKLDPTGPWADEARNRLQATQEKVRNKQSSLMRPFLTPSQIEVESAQARPEELNNRIEGYSRKALEEWLPDYVEASGRKPPEHHAEAALLALANVLRTYHRDFWLSDVLSGPQGPSFDSAVPALSAALKANDNGDYAVAQLAARNASRLFRASGNVAAELRANAEEVYSGHLLYDGQACAALAQNTISRLRSRNYHWLRAQISLEQSNCFDLVGDLGRSKQALDFGTQLAKDNGFSELHSRGIGFQADAAAALGDTQAGFSLASKGLDLFWSTQIGVMKGYNLYTDLDTAADNLRLPYLQVALWNQATSLIDLHPDVVQRAMSHRWYGNAAYLAEMPELAKLEFTRASSLFSSAPRTRATLRGKLDADIWLASLAIRTGDTDRASALLTNIEENLQDAPGFAQEIGFYAAKAEFSLRQGDLDGCGAALRSAVLLAERARTSLSSDSARRQWAQETAKSYRTLVAWKLRQGDADSALEYWEWYKGSGIRLSNDQVSESYEYPARTLLSDPRSAHHVTVPAIVTQQLPILQNETVIAYAVFPEGIASWAFDDRGISTHWIARPQREIEENTGRFLGLCADRTSDINAIRSSARELYDLLIAPFESRLTADRSLIIEPDGALSGLPFEALMDSKGHYLLERASILLSPGVYQSIRARKFPAIGSATPALIVAVPAVDDGSVAPLPNAKTEAQAVARQFNSPLQLQGSAANLAEIRSDIVGVRVFHFAGHALASPERNGLLLNEGDSKMLSPRLLNAQNLDTTQLRELQLAVLSACATGTDLGPGASGTENLAEAMLHAGVPNVVASRWNVDSEATGTLMSEFYTNLIAGRNVATSLRTARLRLASQPGFAHPYYWAAFKALGI